MSSGELTDACRALFGHLAGPVREDRAARCRGMLASGELDPAGLFVARDGGTLRGAVLAQRLPGALGLAWPPRVEPGRDGTAVEDALLTAACGWLRSGGVKVCQVFAAEGDGVAVAPLGRHGFRHVTQVVHMRRELDPGREAFDPAGSPLAVRSTSEFTPELFADTLLKTYDGSLDCPELTGTRTDREVLDGHRPAYGLAAERFWHLARLGDEPVGVVLFDVGSEAGAVELSYLGLVPAVRGRGLGGELVRFAVGHAAGEGHRTLTLSVDVRNGPAVRVYRRHGFREYDRRDVLLATWSG